MQKKKLRELLLNRRENLSLFDYKSKSELICQNLKNWLKSQPITKLFLFNAFKKEPDLSLLNFKDLAIPVAYPVILPDRDLSFYRCDDSLDFKLNKFGINEPPSIKNNQLFPDKKTAVIVPALAVGRTGNRLGFGGGYYDKFLSKYGQVISISVLFADFVLEDIPHESFDVKIQYICTENGIEKTVVC